MEILRAQKCLKEKCVLWPFPWLLEFSKEESPWSLLIYSKIIMSLEQTYLIWCSVPEASYFMKLLNQISNLKHLLTSPSVLYLPISFLALRLLPFLSSKRDKQGADPGILEWNCTMRWPQQSIWPPFISFHCCIALIYAVVSSRNMNLCQNYML